MGNKVGKACGSISGRSKRRGEPEPPAPEPVERHTRRSESLEWLNDLVGQGYELLYFSGKLWPKIDEAVQKIIHEQVTPQLQESLPGPFKGTYFKKCTLGRKTPQLGPIEVVERKESGRVGRMLKLILNIDYQSDVDMEISAVVASIGIKSISLRGQLMIRLGPLIGEMPVVVAGLPMVYDVVHKQINSAINNAMVLPNCISVPLATPEQGVDPALLKKPKPLALLRVKAVRGIDLAARDWNITTKASSDPFVRVRVANDTWNSSVVKQNLNPTWTEDDRHDFDRMSQADLIGKAVPLRALSAPAQSGQPIELLDEKGEPSGSLEMTFDWLTLTDHIEPDAAGCVVMVEIKEMLSPKGESAMVAAQICSQEIGWKWWQLSRLAWEEKDRFSERKEKRTAVMAPAAVALSPEEKLKMDVARRCQAQGLDQAAILEISGLTEDQLRVALASNTTAKTDAAKTDGVDALDASTATASTVDTVEMAAAQAMRPLEFETAFYFSVPQKGLETEELLITALDAKEKPFAKSSLKMSELLKMSSMSLEQLQLDAGGEGLSAKIHRTVEVRRKNNPTSLNHWRVLIRYVLPLVGPGFVSEEWSHVLAWDLFVGRWIYLDGQRRGIFASHSVLFCNLIGPPGLLMHAITCLVLGKGLPQEEPLKNSDA
eukprot:g30958.t1